jgi:hypothetical protein
MTYLELLQIISLMALACVGYQITISQLVHHFTNKWPEDFHFKNEIIRFIAKPLYQCVLCHASVIGTIVFFLFNPLETEYIKYWLIACVVCAWLNGVLYGIFNKLF